VFSSPVSAKGSNFWRFWIAELATHEVSRHPINIKQGEGRDLEKEMNQEGDDMM
jgi:hypothetical protein